jgi:hypothetical protein
MELSGWPGWTQTGSVTPALRRGGDGDAAGVDLPGLHDAALVARVVEADAEAVGEGRGS